MLQPRLQPSIGTNDNGIAWQPCCVPSSRVCISKTLCQPSSMMLLRTKFLILCCSLILSFILLNLVVDYRQIGVAPKHQSYQAEEQRLHQLRVCVPDHTAVTLNLLPFRSSYATMTCPYACFNCHTCQYFSPCT